MAGAIAVRPELWATALRTVWRLRRDRWWEAAPFFPVPSPDYLRFRMVTAYGDATANPSVDDVVTYLRWCRAWPAVRG
jgi:hypothetical protein